MTKRGGGGQKSPILRRNSLWKAPLWTYCGAVWECEKTYANLALSLTHCSGQEWEIFDHCALLTTEYYSAVHRTDDINKKHKCMVRRYLIKKLRKARTAVLTELKSNRSFLMYLIWNITHCFDLDLNDLKTRHNFWCIPGMLGTYTIPK